MPVDHRLRSDDRDGVHHARAETIEPDKGQPIRIGQPQAARCASPGVTIRLAEVFGSHSRNYLKGPDGDRINAVLAAAGYNFSLLLRWLAELLRALIQASQTHQFLRITEKTPSRGSSRTTNQPPQPGAQELEHPPGPLEL